MPSSLNYDDSDDLTNCIATGEFIVAKSEETFFIYNQTLELKHRYDVDAGIYYDKFLVPVFCNGLWNVGVVLGNDRLEIRRTSVTDSDPGLIASWNIQQTASKVIGVKVVQVRSS